MRKGAKAQRHQGRGECCALGALLLACEEFLNEEQEAHQPHGRRDQANLASDNLHHYVENPANSQAVREPPSEAGERDDRKCREAFGLVREVKVLDGGEHQEPHQDKGRGHRGGWYQEEQIGEEQAQGEEYRDRKGGDACPPPCRQPGAALGIGGVRREADAGPRHDAQGVGYEGLLYAGFVAFRLRPHDREQANEARKGIKDAHEQEREDYRPELWVA